MQNDIAQKIRSLASRQEALSESEVCHLMALCRKYLEHLPEDAKQRYPVLAFFCNWSLHITLDRSMAGLRILKGLNDALGEVASVSDNDLLMTTVTKLISFRKLRGEMRTLFEDLKVNDSVERDQVRWETFVKHLIEIIRDCPLMFSQKLTGQARALYGEMTAKPFRKGAWVTCLAITEVDFGLLKKQDSERLMCICILLSNTTRIVVPMAAPEVFGEPT